MTQIERSEKAPGEPNLTRLLEQALEVMNLAELRISHLHGHLFGTNDEAHPAPRMLSVQEMAESLNRRLALLCGDLITINQGVGCPPEEAIGKSR